MLRILLFLITVTLLSSTQSAFSATVGSVKKFSGEVYFRDKDNTPYLPIKAAIELSPGSWIKTGKNGWIELDLVDKSRFTIANNSELELVKFDFNKTTRDGLFTLTHGKLKASVSKTKGLTSSLKVKNKGVVAGVKGTEFLMLSEGPANVFFGNEGKVSISGNDEKEKFLLSQNMTQTTRGYTPIDPVSVEPNTPIAEAKAAFDSATSSIPPEDWSVADNLPNIIARWNITYGHYLADTGKYEQALQVFQIALDLSNISDIRCDARLERSAVYSRFLSNLEAALAENLLILEEYPTSLQSESALFNTGQILFDLSLNEQSKKRFKEYLDKYPEGKHRNNVDTLLGILNKPDNQ
ncbi:MAG: FecR domain-containing protein [Desulfuromonadaceae bacterium]|nr:FecR domain-containing protein [Desulfuromonadaceae bacterium]MDD2856524.1 FecR domain-containing protein [Desulfuromonadaceae bacterium]